MDCFEIWTDIHFPLRMNFGDKLAFHLLTNLVTFELVKIIVYDQIL